MSHPQPSNVAALLPKLNDADADLRYMALSDMMHIFNGAHHNFMAQDVHLSTKVIEGLVQSLQDTNGDVQNQAIKCLGPFTGRCSEAVLSSFIDKVSHMQTKDKVDNSIPALALREIVVALPRPVQGVPRKRAVEDAYSAISKTLLPRLTGRNAAPTQKNQPAPQVGMLENDIKQGTDSNAIDLLAEVARCFGSMLQPKEVDSLITITLDVIEAERANSVLKKKAVSAIAILATYFSDSMLSHFISRLIEHLRNPHLTNGKRRLYFTLLGALSRSIPKKFGAYLKTLTQFITTPLMEEQGDEGMTSDDEDHDPELDDVREAALSALESFLSYCPQDMRAFTNDVFTAATKFIRYDPNLAHDDDEDEDELEVDDEDDDDEDFEAEGGGDDEDDGSWKVRRSAAKVLHSLITTRSSDLLENGFLYGSVAPVLITRFKEREESVRLEILAALTSLARISRSDNYQPLPTVQADGSQGTMGPPPIPKRRRGGSDASMMDSQSLTSISAGYASPTSDTPQSGLQASLAAMVPEIVRGTANHLKTGAMPTKQACLTLLKNVTVTLHGGLADQLDQFAGSVIEILQNPTANSARTTAASTTTTANSLRTEALQLLGMIADLHSSKTIQPFLVKATPGVVAIAEDKFSKVAVEALNALEQIVKALTPPRAASQGDQNSESLLQIYESLVNRISLKETDTEVRRRAISVLGLLLGRTSSTSILPQTTRTAGLQVIVTRLKNELTRLASVRAVDVIASHATKKEDLTAEFVREVSLELSAQFRKSSRSLRGSSLGALRTICTTRASQAHLDEATVKEITNQLLPLLSGEDLHLLGPALVILIAFVRDGGNAFVTPELNHAISQVVTHQLNDHSLDALLTLVRVIGEQGAGKDLMGKLLKVGVSGNPDLTGRAIGTLLVFGGNSDLGVKLEQFVQELSNADERNQILAITVLGEAGFRMGTQSPLKPQQFSACFASKSGSLPLAAAIAMGRAGCGNVAVFLPAILSAMGQQASPQYLLMHSIREILRHREAEAEVAPYAPTLWSNLVAASQSEDNKTIGAECLGRLAIIEPKQYLPKLQAMLNDKKPSVRGMVTSALRFTLADTDDAYDEYLSPIIIPMLSSMLNDTDLENRRLGLTTFNSAMNNKTDLILPHLDQLFPLTMRETVIRPELIREVQMGPFKHKVDDGLEIRKSAYETLYALLERAFPRLDLPSLYERVIAGIADEHDIRILCNLMITKLSLIAPEETTSHLQSIAEKFRVVLATKAKDNAVKQEIEKIEGGKMGVLKVGVGLSRGVGAGMGMSAGGGAGGVGGAGEQNVRAWGEFWESVKKDYGQMLKVAEDEVREKER